MIITHHHSVNQSDKYPKQDRPRPVRLDSGNAAPRKSLPTPSASASASASESKSLNLSALPTEGEYSFTFRPGTIQWKSPKKLAFQPTEDEAQPIELDPVFRLPIDNDDTGAQVRFEWSYNNLKIRPKKITIEAVGPNKAVYSVAEIEGTKTTAVWYLRETPSYTPLVDGHYTILFHDQRGRDTLPKPGWLLPDDKMKIALYRTEGRHVGQDIKRKYSSNDQKKRNEFV